MVFVIVMAMAMRKVLAIVKKIKVVLVVAVLKTKMPNICKALAKSLLAIQSNKISKRFDQVSTQK